MKKTTWLVALALSGATAQAAQYWVKPTVRLLDSSHLDVKVKTNLPDGALLNMDIDLAGQKDSDIYIGIPETRLKVKKGTAHIVVDMNVGVMPSNTKLPAGKYNVVATYMAGWDENRHFGIVGLFQGKANFVLKSGQNSKKAQADYNLQKWAMANIDGNTVWDFQKMVKKFGAFQEYPIQGNSEAVETKMYYFPRIDMTFMIDAPRHKVITWRMGKAVK